MPRLLALDWDRLEARVVVARTSASGVAIDQAVSIPFDVEVQDNTFEGLEQQLSKALSSMRTPKGPALTAIGRSMIELRTMALPPAPDEELPDMVRFQAMREFSSLKEESPLDFVPLGEAAQESGEVMAAAIPLELANQLNQALTANGLEHTRSVMRPSSAVSLAMRRVAGIRQGVTMVIAQQSESVELSVTKNGLVVFTRSFRLPADWHPGESGEPLLGEVRRTIAAAQNQLGGAKVERLVLFGTPSEHNGLCERLRDRTKLDVELLDPFEGIKVSGATPTQPERFAALIGMLQDEAAETPPIIDFVNPRKKPEPESNRRQNVLYLATAVTVLLGLVFAVWWKHDGLNKQIRASERQINKLANENKNLQATVTLAQKLDEWKKSDKNWLDEIAHLSNSDELTPEDFRLESFQAQTMRDGVGDIRVRGRSKDLEARQILQTELNDEHHDVIPGLMTVDQRQDSRYPIVFTTIIQTDSFMAIDLAQAPAATPTGEVSSQTMKEPTSDKESAIDDEKESSSDKEESANDDDLTSNDKEEDNDQTSGPDDTDSDDTETENDADAHQTEAEEAQNV